MGQHLIELRLRCAVGLDLAEMRLLEGIHAFGDGEVDVLHLAGRFIEFLHESVARIIIILVLGLMSKQAQHHCVIRAGRTACSSGSCWKECPVSRRKRRGKRTRRWSCASSLAVALECPGSTWLGVGGSSGSADAWLCWEAGFGWIFAWWYPGWKESPLLGIFGCRTWSGSGLASSGLQPPFFLVFP